MNDLNTSINPLSTKELLKNLCKHLENEFDSILQTKVNQKPDTGSSTSISKNFIEQANQDNNELHLTLDFVHFSFLIDRISRIPPELISQAEPKIKYYWNEQSFKYKKDAGSIWGVSTWTRGWSKFLSLSQQDESAGKTALMLKQELSISWDAAICLVLNFLIGKVQALKLGPFDSRGLLISPNNPSLELFKIKPKDLEGWEQLQGNLNSLVCKKGIETADSLFLDTLGIKVNTSEQPDETLKTNSINQHKKWEQLQVIDLSKNQLDDINKTISLNIIKCEKLNLSYNNFPRIPSSLVELYNLTNLNLSSNAIGSLSKVNQVLGNIRVLNLSNNQIHTLLGLEKLWGLEQLDLSNNLIEDIEEIKRLTHLPNLAKLSVSGNPFTSHVGYRSTLMKYFAERDSPLLLDGNKTRVTDSINLNRISAAMPPEPKRSSTLPSVMDPNPSSMSILNTNSNLDFQAPFKEKHIVTRKAKGKKKAVKRVASIYPLNETPEDGNSEANSMQQSIPIDLPQSSANPNIISKSAIRISDSQASSLPLHSQPLIRHTSENISSTRMTSPTQSLLSIQSPNLGKDFQKRIEALKAEAGPSWLKVYQAMQQGKLRASPPHDGTWVTDFPIKDDPKAQNIQQSVPDDTRLSKLLWDSLGNLSSSQSSLPKHMEATRKPSKPELGTSI
ncbi:hypothetical protein CONCODRAFT_78836 [Conidiobolus coronatus NRRL 28638]|uniref:L domain-like protein n=1 Tax=Conidiobolus coronatus (strain ATCC 28846 / CBS 209.66 / NRRL 28638) TaxID=796925 RepID=A0A137P6D1_CONC2|nr:hypothetical protein CONCODRAFT_78836 [Conidiobolus coronatus NRRL 28638]|eukprot:KXN70471.1 hypothetical protein CONCODRAFT_78836 [Conidiobolus coronatus NRRL 28638]